MFQHNNQRLAGARFRFDRVIKISVEQDPLGLKLQDYEIKGYLLSFTK